PASGNVRVSSNMRLRASASDPDGIIASVQFFANGTALAAPITAFPYEMQWTPTAEGIYRLTAIAVDDTGAAATSPTVVVVSSASAAGSSVATGTYGGPSPTQGIEFGNFAFASGGGGTAAFIGYSTTSGIEETYFISGILLNAAGGFSKSDSAGKTLISGTGTSGTVDAGRLTFIGLDTAALAGDTVFPGGFYSGSLSGRSGSTFAAILGADGSLVLYAADGENRDAAGGGMTGKVSTSGAFSFVTLKGNTISGQVNPSTGVLTGTLSGPNGGSFNLGSSTLAFPGGSIVTGDGSQVASNIVDPRTGYTYDQALLEGASASITADPGQITRISFVDLSNDIVQVEFSGAGELKITLENPSGPFPAMFYNQSQVSYMKGHAGIVITGADETTNVSVFSVGPVTSVNQSLFKTGVNYDGVADLSHIVILSTDGKFGGVFAGNASFFAAKGLTGLAAPGVQFTNRVAISDISAYDAATPMLLVGSANELLITGGDLWQRNDRSLQVGGFSEIQFVNGTTSHGILHPAQPNLARFEILGYAVSTSNAGFDFPE
ncbi:MAG: Ig-like domain-containing protein, partial [Opitutus sp.]